MQLCQGRNRSEEENGDVINGYDSSKVAKKWMQCGFGGGRNPDILHEAELAAALAIADGQAEYRVKHSKVGKG
ncbi:hypothetical protein SAMN05421878_1253 [Actinobaculum suis]|uniref:Uncharacterized protein n=1 Tax=Actinobaculum suis TaxID=1657 RepID=A0A1G7EVS6_9ACTO|nr:hypothetical protein SAMN05421878_1253 [Actinobaculum suis]